MIKKIEIENVGEFEVAADMTHRPRIYLKLKNAPAQYKQVQFDSLKLLDTGFQLGYDYQGNDINIKII